MRILNHSRLLAVIGLCGLINLAGLAVNIAALGQPAALTPSQSEALNAYNKTAQDFRSILKERRAQIDTKQKLSEKPGQALYLARVAMMGAYKDLTDVLPSRIGRPNKYKIPPAYFDADNEPLVDEYKISFASCRRRPPMRRHPIRPTKTLSILGQQLLGLRASMRHMPKSRAASAWPSSSPRPMAIRTSAMRVRNPTKEVFRQAYPRTKLVRRNGRRSRKSVAALDPKLNARDDKEEARVGNSDQRYNHWTAVRNGLMNAHAELFPKIPAIMKALPDPIDQMRFFELIQIIPSPAKSALNSGNLLNYRISEPRIMGYLRNNSMFAYGKADRAKTSATMREILDSMWLFNDIFDRALAKFGEIKAQQKG